MTFWVGIKKLSRMLLICGFIYPAQAQMVAPELSSDANVIILQDLLSTFKQSQGDGERYLGFQLDVKHGKETEYALLNNALVGQGYLVCSSVGVKASDCRSNLSWFADLLDESLGLYHAGLRVNGHIEVSRFYDVVTQVKVTPVTNFYFGNVTNKSNLKSEPENHAVIIEPLVKSVVDTELEEPIKLEKSTLSRIGDSHLQPKVVQSALVKDKLPVPIKKAMPIYWQVQLIASVDEAAMLKIQQHFEKSSGESVLVYEEPFFKLRVGHYSNGKALLTAQHQYRKEYPGAFAVKVVPGLE